MDDGELEYGFLEQQLMLYASLCADQNNCVKDKLRPRFPYDLLLMAIKDDDQDLAIRTGFIRLIFELYVDPLFLSQFHFTRIYRGYTTASRLDLPVHHEESIICIISFTYIYIYIVELDFEELNIFIIDKLKTAKEVIIQVIFSLLDR